MQAAFVSRQDKKYVQAITQFRSVAEHGVFGVNLDDVVKDINRHSFYYLARIQGDMLATNHYGAICRDQAFANTIRQMTKDARKQRDDGRRSFYGAISHHYDSGSDHPVYQSFRAAFEARAECEQPELDILQRYGGCEDFTYVAASTADTQQAAILLDALPYSQHALRKPKP